MILVDAFLIFTVFAYYFCAVCPKQVTKNLSLYSEKASMALLGSLLLGNLLINIDVLWFVYGVFWTFAACMSYYGFSKWNVQWKEDISEVAQIAMWLWDTAISTCCFMKFQTVIFPIFG